MSRPGLTTADRASLLPGAFLDRFAVVGRLPHCVRRLREPIGLGLDQVIVVLGSRDAPPDALAESDERFATAVLPVLTGRTSAAPRPREESPA